MSMLARRQNINDWNDFGFFSPFEKFGLEMSKFFGRPFWGEEAASGKSPLQTDIFTEGNNLIVRANLPGIKPGDINVNVKDNILTIDAERKNTKTEEPAKGKTYFRSERAQSSFHGSITLPDRVKVDAVTAESKNGVLTIHLPRYQEAKPKQICVACK